MSLIQQRAEGVKPSEPRCFRGSMASSYGSFLGSLKGLLRIEEDKGPQKG